MQIHHHVYYYYSFVVSVLQFSFDGHLDSSIRSTEEANYFSLQNESISDTLLDKFSNMTATNNSINDRIITRIAITKDAPSKSLVNLDGQPAAEQTIREPTDYAMAIDASLTNHSTNTDNGMTLGISIVQGSDSNVYVKDLVKNGPGDRYGILIGDQVRVENSTNIYSKHQ